MPGGGLGEVFGRRRTILHLSTGGLAITLIALVWIPEPPLAYLAMALLGISTAIYLVPEGGGDAALSFPRSHSFFTFMRRANAATTPLTFTLVLAGTLAVVNNQWATMGVLAVLRMLPEIILDHMAYRRRRDLMSNAPAIESLSQVGNSPMVKASGFIFETRTRRKRLGRGLFNVWLLDSSLGKVFIPGMVEVRGITERIREGAWVSLVGPSTESLGIRAIQPVASVVIPPGWDGGDACWMDVLRRRLLLRRLSSSAAGSLVYMAAVTVMAFITSQLRVYVGLVPAAVAISLLASIFFWVLGEKSAREASSYEVRWYFEPKWSGLPDSARKNRLERLEHQAGSGLIRREYVGLLKETDKGTI
jgi:hypothetical protein